MKNSGFYKNQAKNLMQGKTGTFALAYLVYILVLGVSMLTFIGPIIIMGPLAVGLTAIGLNIVKGRNVSVGDLFSGFGRFGAAFGAMFFMSLFLTGWYLVGVLTLMIPFIMATFSYSMTFFVIADNPNISGLEAITESKNLMKGHRWELFKLEFSFIGWMLLAPFTMGILYFWLVPYMQTSMAVFYTDLKVLRYGNAEPYGQAFQQVPYGQAPYGQDPQQAPYGQAPYGQNPQQAPFGQAPYGQDPQQAPFGQAPYGQAPQQAPFGQAPYGQAPQQAPFSQDPFATQNQQSPYGNDPFANNPFGNSNSNSSSPF